MDEIFRTIRNDIRGSFSLNRQKRDAFLAALIAGVITHIYYMVNLPGSEDTAFANFVTRPDFSASRLFGGANTGRWLGPVIDLVESWYRPFYVSGWITILVMGAISLIIIDLLGIRSRSAAILAAVFLEVYPATQAYIVLGEISYPIASAFAAFAALLTVKNKSLFKSVWAAVLLALSLVVLPTGMSVYITLILIWLIVETAEGQNETARDRLMIFIRAVLILLIAGVFLLISSRVISSAVGVGSTSYQGADVAVSGAFLESLGSNFIQAYKKFVVQGLWKIQIMPRLRFTVYVVYIGTLCGTFYLWKKNGKPGGRKRLLVLCLLCLMIPMALCTITLISHGFMYRGQHRLPLGFLLVSFLVVLDRVFSGNRAGERREAHGAGENVSTGEKESISGPGSECASAKGKGLRQKKRNRIIFVIAIADFMLMLYGFFLYDNIGYQVQLYVQEKDTSLCTRILAALDQEKDFSYDQPVYFVNIVDWDEMHDTGALKYDPELDTVIWPVSTSNLYAYGDASVRSYMIRAEGAELVSPDEEEVREIEEKHFDEVYQDIPAWDFEIEKVGDVTVVIMKTIMPPSVLYG